MANHQPSPRVVLISRQQILESAYSELRRFEQEKAPSHKPIRPFAITLAIGLCVLLCLLLALRFEARNSPTNPQPTNRPIQAQ